MNEKNKIYIDQKLNSIIRSYTKNDNILFTLGIDNLILGLINSENEESNIITDNSYLKKIKDIIPLGAYLNGKIAINNKNINKTFQSILDEHLEKIKIINKDLLIHKSGDEIKYIQIILKELPYLDDEDNINCEFKKFGDKSNKELEIIFCDNLIQTYFSGIEAKYKFIVHKVQILFNNQNNIKNAIEFKKEQLKDEKYLDEIFDINENKGIILKLKQKDLIINNNSDSPQYFDYIIIKDYNKTNYNINKLYYANVQLGFKKNNNDEKIFEYIKIIDVNIKEDLKTNLYMETIGIISFQSKNNDKILKIMLSQLKKIFIIYSQRIIKI